MELPSLIRGIASEANAVGGSKHAMTPLLLIDFLFALPCFFADVFMPDFRFIGTVFAGVIILFTLVVYVVLLCGIPTDSEANTFRFRPVPCRCFARKPVGSLEFASSSRI